MTAACILTFAKNSAGAPVMAKKMSIFANVSDNCKNSQYGGSRHTQAHTSDYYHTRNSDHAIYKHWT